MCSKQVLMDEMTMKMIRKIFFYMGQDKYFVMEMLENYDFFPHFGIRNLLDKSLITISNNKLCMHILLQQIMGWKIAWQESIKDHGKCSRFELYDDIKHVLTRNTVRLKFIDSLSLPVYAQAENHSLKNNLFIYFVLKHGFLLEHLRKKRNRKENH